MQSLVVADTAIRQDAEGRYCLNDLHRAAGGEKRHGPSYWLANQQTIELVRELETTEIPVVTVEGRRGGTFACKELVYAYAMWVSAPFHLRVIRAYDQLVSAPQHPAIPQTLPEALRLAADLAEQKAAAEARVALMEPKVAAFERIADTDGTYCLREAAKILGVPERQFIARLNENRWIYRQADHWLGYQPRISSGYLDHKARKYRIQADDGRTEERSRPQVRITNRGITKLAELFQTVIH